MGERSLKPIVFYRHPLQEQTVDIFVPNDILIVGGAGSASCPAIHGNGDDSDHAFEENTVGNSVVICTGANACGKVRESLGFLFPKTRTKTFCETQSVYLKQVRFIRVLFSEKIWTPIAILGSQRPR